MKFEEVDIAVEKPEYRGWFNMTADCLPRAMGRVWFDGERFHLVKSSARFSEFPEGAKIYWLRGTKE